MSKADLAPECNFILTDGRKKKPVRMQPTKPLPTNRIAVSKQIEILRAYAASSEPDRRPVTNADVGSIVDMQGSTVSLANAFFTATGLLERAEGGYLPSPEVASFFRAFSWNPDTAAHKLAPVLGRAWFCQTLMGKLRFRPMDEQEAITDLAEASEAGPEYRVQLKMLLDFMEIAGIIIRDGNNLRLAPPSGASSSGDEPVVSSSDKNNRVANEARADDKDAFSTTFAKAGGGGVNFTIAVQIDMRELSTWSADRIAALLGGIAQVLAAKGANEVKESSI